jgi:hypothetical protein
MEGLPKYQILLIRCSSEPLHLTFNRSTQLLCDSLLEVANQLWKVKSVTCAHAITLISHDI